MGYMGFGMRKESYTRKPKKVFSGIKKVYGENPKLPDTKVGSKPKPTVHFKRKRFKHFYQMKPFKILTVSTLLLTFLYIFGENYVKDIYWQYQREVFEAENLPVYFDTHKEYFAEINEYFSKRRDRIRGIRYSMYPATFPQVIRISYPGIYQYKPVDGWVSKSSLASDNDHHIIGHSLIFEKRGYEKSVYEKNWFLQLGVSPSDTIQHSICAYMGVEQHEIKMIMESLRKNQQEISIDDQSVIIHFSDATYGEYAIVYSDKTPSMEVEDNNPKKYYYMYGKLDEGVYWRRLVLRGN